MFITKLLNDFAIIDDVLVRYNYGKYYLQASMRFHYYLISYHYTEFNGWIPSSLTPRDIKFFQTKKEAKLFILKLFKLDDI
jgi:hypothetical protein